MFSAIFAKLNPLQEGFGITQRNGVFLSTAKNEWAVGRGATVDAPPDVWVNLNKRNASSMHAVIIWDPVSKKAAIQDCCDRNGTYINGNIIKPGTCVLLDDGDRIWLGPIDDPKSCGFTYQYLWGSYNPFLSEYGCEAKLGSGSFGDVYKFFRRSRPAEVYAVKVLDYSEAGGRNNYEDAVAEMNILSREARAHPNICAVIEAYQDDEHDTMYILMPYMPLGDLTRHFTNNTGTGIDAFRVIMKQVCAGLMHIHSYGITHRDVKPANILFKSWSPLKIALSDFGAACVTMDIEKPEMQSLIGSFAYMAPEVGRRTGYNNKVDSYSLGATGLHLFVGLKHDLFHTADALFSVANLMPWFESRRIRWELARSRNLPHQGHVLLTGLLDVNPETRWSMAQVASFPWIKDAQDVNEAQYRLEPTIDLKHPKAPPSTAGSSGLESLSASYKFVRKVSHLLIESATTYHTPATSATYATAFSTTPPVPLPVPPVREGARRSPRQHETKYIERAREREERRAEAEACFFERGGAKARKAKAKAKAKGRGGRRREENDANKASPA